MVCTKCEKVAKFLMEMDIVLKLWQKLSKVAAPDPFQSSSSSIRDGSRKIGENKLLGRPGVSKNRHQVRASFPSSMNPSPMSIQPYQGKCRDCKSSVTQNKAKYCHGASHPPRNLPCLTWNSQAAHLGKAYVQSAPSQSLIHPSTTCPTSNPCPQL